MELDEEYLRRRFEGRIVGDVFRHAHPSGRPVTVLLGAQPGAGKTAGGNRVVAMYPVGAVVRIMGDDLRQYHPEYARLMATEPLRMPDETDAAMRRWIDMCVEYANEHGYGILIERTWRSVEATLGSARDAVACGRETHAVVVAVPPEISRLSTLGRYYRDVDGGLPARWTPPEVHDTAADQLPITVRHVAASPDVRRFTVTDRSGAILFDSSESPTIRASDGLAAFQAAFRRALTVQEQAQVLLDVAYYVEAHARHTAGDPAAREVIRWAERLAHEPESTGVTKPMSGPAARDGGRGSTGPTPPLSFPKPLRSGRSADTNGDGQRSGRASPSRPSDRGPEAPQR